LDGLELRDVRLRLSILKVHLQDLGRPLIAMTTTWNVAGAAIPMSTLKRALVKQWGYDEEQ
jgi:hypothetical protein